MKPQERFDAFRNRLESSLIEREDEISAALVGLLTKQNVFFCGEPGTGKSMLANMLGKWMGGAVFTIQLNKHTAQEELFGALDPQALLKGIYRRNTKGKLPEATVAIVDEIWNASSAIANTLLELFNERVYRNNGSIIQCPLRSVISASNHTPHSYEGGKELSAMFDRFLIRKMVVPVMTDEGQRRLLWDNLSQDVGPEYVLSTDDLDEACRQVKQTKWNKAAKECYEEILAEIKKEGIVPGDRRKRLSVEVGKATAWLEGKDAVDPEHLEMFSHTLWRDPEGQPQKVAKVVARLACPNNLIINQLTEEVAEIMGKNNLDNLEVTAENVKKLGEIDDRLREIDSRKAKAARAYVASQRVLISQRWAR